MRAAIVTICFALVSCGVADPVTTVTDVGSDPVATQPPATTEPSSIPTTTATASSSTLALVTSTTMGSSTTTTSLPDGVGTSHPNLPSALDRSEIPWASVGAGWYVVLYDSSKAAPTGPDDVRDGPVVMYLVDSAGTLFETAAWPPDDRPWQIVDVAPDGSRAIVLGSGATLDTQVWDLIDLRTGAVQRVHEISYPETNYGWGSSVSLTRPTGANVVVFSSDGTDEWLERWTPDGSVLATLYRQPYIDPIGVLRWMYGYDGTTVLVAHHGGIALLRNDGTRIRELWTPMDHRCTPARWWDSDTFLASCSGLGPASAPIDEFGDPHTYYGQLWLLEIDGTAGDVLTTLPTDPVFVGDFGYHDAWTTGSETYIDWSGDCGASATRVLQSDGTAVDLSMSIPASIVADGWTLIDAVSGQLVIYAWQGCTADVGALFAADETGAFTHDLVPVIGDARSVISARGLAEVYP